MHVQEKGRGSWSGERGDSLWTPDANENPEILEAMNDYGVNEIPYSNDMADLSAFSNGSYQVPNFPGNHA